MVNSSSTNASSLSEHLRSFWVIPTLFAGSALLTAVLLVLLETGGTSLLPALLPGGAGGARAVLSSIVTAMISFTALVFSITVVALQLASSQFSPRVLRTYQRDRITQTALGTFVATFLYAMVVLAAVPGEDAEGKPVPHLATLVAMLLVLLSVAVFIIYIHHITSLIQVGHMVAAIGKESRGVLDRWYPAHDTGRPTSAPSGPGNQTVHADIAGVLRDVDVDALATLAERHSCHITVIPALGQFVPAGAPLLTVHHLGPGADDAVPDDRACRAVNLGRQRSMQKDLAFGFQQLADIAARALSPGYNDVTTALQCLDQIHDLLRRSAGRPLHPNYGTRQDPPARVHIAGAGMPLFLSIGVEQIADAGRSQPRVIARLTELLDDVLSVADDRHRLDLLACRRTLAGTAENDRGTGGPSR